VGSYHIINEKAVSDLQSTIDHAVHFYFYLTEHMQITVDPDDEATEDIILGITSFAEYFRGVRTSSHYLLRGRLKHFKWNPIASPQALKKKYLASYK
jgi:hypothetical protein